ncbi:MAG: hypothetical protein V9F03_17285 [Microthrixaceae bacterium]
MISLERGEAGEEEVFFVEGDAMESCAGIGEIDNKLIAILRPVKIFL